MKNTILTLTVILAVSLITNAQAVPTQVSSFLKKNYSDWKIGESWVADSKPRKALEKGDFNGDGKTDYAVLITKDDRIYALALLNTGITYKAVNLLAQDADNRWIAGIDIFPKDSMSEMLAVKADGIEVYDGERHGKVFYWQNGKFVNKDTNNLPETSQEKYVGLKYDGKNLPKELEYVGGFIITKTEDYQDASTTPYAISMARPKGKNASLLMLWFDKSNKESDPKKLIVEVLDVLNLPKLKKTEAFAMGGCHLNGKFDGELFAIAVYQEKEYLTKIVKAWRANMTTEKIESIPVAGIKCFNEGYGV